MSDRLIITNGDDAVARMREAGIRGEILPWRDILHEGPVPPSLSLEELSTVRAQFLAQRGWLPEEELHGAFRSRDAMIRRHGEFETVVLWFEHDLYDQLQLIQLLDFFAAERREGVYLIQAGKYLGREKPRALKTHFHLMEPVREAHLALARLAWSGFRAATPEPWAGLLGLGTHVLPFLRLATLRLLDELPHPASGLSRTDWMILSLVAQGVKKPLELYEAFTESEEVFFMGDLSFYHALDRLGAGGAPLDRGLQGDDFFSFDAGRGAGCVPRSRVVVHASRHHGPVGEIGCLAAAAFGSTDRWLPYDFTRAMALGPENSGTHPAAAGLMGSLPRRCLGCPADPS